MEGQIKSDTIARLATNEQGMEDDLDIRQPEHYGPGIERKARSRRPGWGATKRGGQAEAKDCCRCAAGEDLQQEPDPGLA